jgi:hypothetical protein
MSFIGATGLDEVQEQFDILQDNIDATNDYINKLYGIPDPTHTAIFGINILNPNLYGLVERAEVNIKALQLGEEGITTNIEGIDTTISGIETEISGIQTEITGIQTEIAGIQTEIAGVQTEITGLEGSISTIQFVELPAIGVSIGLVSGVANDALSKANKSLGIWDESGNDVYHKKSGNVGIGTTFGSVLNNKLEVNGNINIPTGSTFRINNEPFNYTHLAGTQPVSSKWTNATDTATNIYYNTGNVGIGTISGITNKLEVGGNLNISAGSKYKINNVNLAFSDLGGTLSYNSLTDKPTLFDGNYNSLTNKLTQGTNIQITSGNVINNTYSLPTAGIGAGGILGGVRVDNSTIFINGSGIISSAGGTAQVNSDWAETNTSLKSFILNKPTIVNSRWSLSGNEISYNAGNVGIGTSNPFNVLHLHKLGVLQETGIILSDDSTITSSTNRGLHFLKGANNEGYLFNYENKELIFGTFGTERMRILANGNVGIGTATTTTGVLLDVNGIIETRTSIGVGNGLYFKGVANSDLSRVISAGTLSTGSAVNDTILRSTNKLVLQSGTANPAMVIDTANNLGINTNTLIQSKLTINPIVSDNNSFNHSEAPLTITNQTPTSSSVLNDPKSVLHLCRQGTSGQTFGAKASFKLCRYENIFPSSRTRLDITLAHDIYDDKNVMSIQSNGKIGFGLTNPQHDLHLHKTGTTQDVRIQFTDDTTTTGAPRGVHIGKDTNGTAFLYNFEDKTILFGTNAIGRFQITGDGLRFQRDVWHRDLDNNMRLYFLNGSTTYISGYGSTPIEFRQNGSNPIAWFNTEGELTCMFESQTTTDSDHIIIRGNTALTQRGRYRMLIGYQTFTGFHRCYYQDDEYFNNDMSKEDIDIFKNNYKGRIVISTGKIKTDFTRDVPKTDEQIEEVKIDEEVKIEDITEEETTKEEPPPISSTPKEETKSEWYSAIDKDGITIEEAIPIIQLCKVRKDKRVYGVLGSPTRSTNNKGRLIVNSLGEGAICVCNTNGNIENGDYIQSSDVLGYGEKQDDDILHNYSVAKAVMDCTFELDSPYYQCYELANGVRVALIACTYHCA